MSESESLTPSVARERIRRIQNGSGLASHRFPDTMKGEIARRQWHDPMFSYGMEYGYLLAMVDLTEGADSTAASDEEGADD